MCVCVCVCVCVCAVIDLHVLFSVRVSINIYISDLLSDAEVLVPCVPAV